jgi:hypothetical protein
MHIRTEWTQVPIFIARRNVNASYVEYMVRKPQLWHVYPQMQTPLSMIFSPLLLGLEVVEKDRSLLRLLTPILDNNARAVDNLACISLTIQDT